jgi:hypothetical protein
VPGRLGLLFLALALVAAAAGCGGNNEASSNTTTKKHISVQAEAAYEHAYSECASFSLQRLATKYHVNRNRAAVVTAVAADWGSRFGARDSVRAARAGCDDGFDSRTSGA